MSSPAYAACPGRTLEAPTNQRARTARSRPWLLPYSTAFAVECGVLNGGGATDGPRGSRRLWRLRGACARPPDETPPAAVRGGVARRGGRLEHRPLPGVAPHAAARHLAHRRRQGEPAARGRRPGGDPRGAG